METSGRKNGGLVKGGLDLELAWSLLALVWSLLAWSLVFFHFFFLSWTSNHRSSEDVLASGLSVGGLETGVVMSVDDFSSSVTIGSRESRKMMAGDNDLSVFMQ